VSINIFRDRAEARRNKAECEAMGEMVSYPELRSSKLEVN
jgi:hypothetical protein